MGELSAPDPSSLMFVFEDKSRGRIKFITELHKAGQKKKSRVWVPANQVGRVATPSDFTIKTMVTAENLTKKYSPSLFQFTSNHKMHVTAELGS